MRFALTIVTVLCATFCVPAQEKNDQAEIRKVIEKLFTGMQRGDSTMVKDCFSKEVSLATIYRNKNGDPVNVRENSIAGFMKDVGTPHKEVWHEEIWNLEIKVDGEFASVWCDYAFYLDDTFSHCGVDAFHLHREQNGWKIFHLADTRRRNDCRIPEAIKAKHPVK